MVVKFLPLAVAFNHHPGAPHHHLVGRPIGRGGGSHHVACGDGDVSKDLDVDLDESVIVLHTRIELGFEAFPLLLCGGAFTEEPSTGAVAVPFGQMILYPGIHVSVIAGKVMALLQGNDIFHITGLDSGAE